MTSQQEADRALAEHWAEREQKEREQRKQKRRLIVVGDHDPELSARILVSSKAPSRIS